MTTMLSSVSKKIAGVAFAAMALVSGTCMAGGCPEPGCVNVAQEEIGTAVQYEIRNDGSEAIRIRGEKDEVILELTKQKFEAIKNATLSATWQNEKLDDLKDYEAILLLKPNPMAVGYPGFAKIVQYTGDFDTVSTLIVELQEKDYEVFEFEGFGYEPNPEARIVAGKPVNP